MTPDQIEIFSIGTGNAPFELVRSGVFGGLWAWKEVIKAAMFLTTDNATAQAKLLLGPGRCLRLEPAGADALVELDDYDGAFARLAPKPLGGDRHSYRMEAHAEEILALVAETPDITLAEIADHLEGSRGLRVALSTVWRLLDRHGQTFKKNRARKRTATA